jgi:predicted HNH restriction endonuclease
MKICPNCEKIVTKRNNKYCDAKCQVEFVNRIVYENIENGYTTLYLNHKTFKRHLIIKYGEKCMECDWDKINPLTGKVPIQLEHTDGNSDNNSLDNLKLLCPNCHSLTPTYGALNKGFGRKNRKR